MAGIYVTTFWLAATLLVILSGTKGCKLSKAEPTVTQATEPVMHGEGPHWDSETGVLFFVDIASELVNRYDPSTDQLTQAKFPGGGVTLVVPVEGTEANQLLLSRGHDIIVVTWNNQENATFDSSNNSENFTVIATVETGSDKTGNRWNDGKADARGRLWAGTMGPEPVVGQVTPDQGSFYLLQPNEDPVVEIAPVTISNGLAWNKDNTLLYYIDTPTNQVDVFDFDLDAGEISNRRKVFNVSENGLPGHPDGMTIDSKENLWVACFDGGQIINVDPRTGTLLRTVALPASRVTSAMFGGPELSTLYVTTSRLGLSDDELQKQPLAGSVFAITGLGVTGLNPANDVLPNLGKHY